ncbi:MAG: hypothetical protein K8S22_00350 [Betaproteobacteria bacterium]|nr:hypothetical protein [Betaproteobacteria bacterium]
MGPAASGSQWALSAIIKKAGFLVILAGLATVFLVNTMRAMRAEQGAMRRAIANMDWTTVLGHLQSSGKESVRILDIIDKRLQKLEALEKLQISQSSFKQNR